MRVSDLRQTHTFATLEVSQSTFDEIEKKMCEAGYDHVFIDGLIDMHGLALEREKSDQIPASAA